MSNLIVTRFTHGAAGKFLSTVLQTSNLIDHWNNTVQEQKECQELSKSVTLEYVRRSFPIDHSMHMVNEPMVPYNTSLYSTGYPRGNDISYKEYCSQVDARMDLCKSKKLLANIVFHKPNIPLFCKGARTVTIMTTTKQEQSWVHNALWSKQFLETQDKIIKLDLSPTHCNLSSLPNILKFNPQFEFKLEDKEEIFNKFVVNDHCALWYTDYNYFKDFDRDFELDNAFIDIKNFFDQTTFMDSVEQLFMKLNLGKPDVELIKSMHDIWWSRQCKQLKIT